MLFFVAVTASESICFESKSNVMLKSQGKKILLSNKTPQQLQINTVSQLFNIMLNVKENALLHIQGDIST